MLQRCIHRLHHDLRRNPLIPAYFRHKYRVLLIALYLKNRLPRRRQVIPSMLALLLRLQSTDLARLELLLINLPAESLLLLGPARALLPNQILFKVHFCISTSLAIGLLVCFTRCLIFINLLLLLITSSMVNIRTVSCG